MLPVDQHSARTKLTLLTNVCFNFVYECLLWHCRLLMSFQDTGAWGDRSRNLQMWSTFYWLSELDTTTLRNSTSRHRDPLTKKDRREFVRSNNWGHRSRHTVGHEENVSGYEKIERARGVLLNTFWKKKKKRRSGKVQSQTELTKSVYLIFWSSARSVIWWCVVRVTFFL